MKLKSLILGSIAAAGLSTAGFAADLGVLTSLDVCDELGLSGLTISSDTNCLQISGGVSYEFRFGDFRAADVYVRTPFGNSLTSTQPGSADFMGPNASGENDWSSKVEAWLKFVGTANSDFGAAKAVIKIKQREAYRTTNGVYTAWSDDDGAVVLDEGYVSVGDSTVLMVGKKGTIANFGDSTPFNFLQTFGYSAVDVGIGIDNDDDLDQLGGQSIQIVSDLGNGVNVGVALENLDGENGTNYDTAGSLVGVVGYAGENVTAHLTAIAAGVIDGDVDGWALHAGATGTFDAFKLRATAAYIRNDVLDYDRFHGLLSAETSLDMFKLAASGEYQRSEAAGVVDDGFGFGGSIGATVSEGVAVNFGARYFSADFEGADIGNRLDNDAVQVAAQVVASLTETIKVTGEVGVYLNDVVLPSQGADEEVYYGSAALAWNPGGGFTSSLQGDVYSNDAYRVQFRAAKSFE